VAGTKSVLLMQNCGVSLEMDMFGHAEKGRSEVRGMLKEGSLWRMFTENRDVAHVGPGGQ
jgi:hypothetical protein